jgi:hypothetical protein
MRCAATCADWDELLLAPKAALPLPLSSGQELRSPTCVLHTRMHGSDARRRNDNIGPNLGQAAKRPLPVMRRHRGVARNETFVQVGGEWSAGDSNDTFNAGARFLCSAGLATA